MEMSQQQLIDLGYVIRWISGMYCCAWLGHEEFLLRWENGAWIVL